MARKVSQGDPALAIEFWLSGFYTHRSQLFAPFKGIGVNVVSFHDPVIDGANMEDSDLYEWTRRPGFSIFCPVSLPDSEIINQFYSMRNLTGEVISFFDSTARLATFTSTDITTIIAKTTTEEGFITPIQNMVYFSDGAAADIQKWQSAQPLSAINPSPWGLPAPTLTPTITSLGCWLPFTYFVVNNAILDPNGSVEVVTNVYGASGLSGGNEPLWPTTISSTINDGSIQWTNSGPLQTWYPATYYPVPVVILDPNGNLQLAITTAPAVLPWDSGTTYAVGTTVSYAGLYWTSTAASTDVAPSGDQTVATAVGDVVTTVPYWVQAANPAQTGIYPNAPYYPDWNTAVGGTTTDGNYTWTNLGPGNLVESFGTSYVYCYRTIYGHLSTASPVSINTGSIFGPTVATITAFSIAGNVVTFTTPADNFVPGDTFTVQGLTSPLGMLLNNQPFTVLATGLTTMSFSSPVPASLTGVTGASPDSGSTVNLVASITGRSTTSVLCNAVVNITATEVVAGVVTVYAINQFVPGLQVTFAGLTVATFLNGAQFQIINIDPNGTWFQVYYTTSLGVVPPDQAQTTDTGTATFNAIEIYRTSDGGGIYLLTGAVTNPMSGASSTYDSGVVTAGTGTDDGTPGVHVWANPGNVSSDSAYATVSVPTPTGGGGGGRFMAVQTCQNIIAGNSTSILTQAFTGAVTGGNAILVYVTTYDVSSWVLTDSQGNTYSQVAQVALPNDHGIVTVTAYLATGVAAGSTTLQISVLSPQSNSFFGIQAMECKGLSGVTDIVATASRNTESGGGSTFSTGSATTSNAVDVVFTLLYNDLNTNSGNVGTPPVGWTPALNQTVFVSGDGSTYQQMGMAYQVQAATGTFSPVWTTPSQSKALGATIALELSLFNPSDGLNAQTFDFVVPPAIQISGITVSFNAYFTGTNPYGILDVQLLRGGLPVGTVMQIALTNTPTAYTLGGPNTVWGATWTPAEFNASTWGVQFVATQLTGGSDAVFSVNDVTAHIVGSTNTDTWVFNDFTTDANLNILQIAPQNHLNDPPPGAPGSSVNQTVGNITTYWNGRIWMAVGNFVYFDAGPDCINGVPEEAWPPANRFQFVGPVYGLTPSADGVALLVYLADRVAMILGGPETISFYPSDGLGNFGISSPNALFYNRDGSIIGQFTTQKQYFELVDRQKQEIGEHISDYLTANFTAADTYVTMHRDGLDVGVFLSNGVDQILRYGSNIGAWSVPAYPLCGAGALRSIETSVGVYSLMLASPTGGVTSHAGPVNAGLGQSLGAGVAWTDPENITAGSPTTYATVAIDNDSSALLAASTYVLNLPTNAIVQGVEVAVTGKATVPTMGNGGGISAFDQQTTNFSVSGTAVSVGPLTPSVNPEWALFSLASSGGPLFTMAGGWSVFDAAFNARSDFAFVGQSLSSLAPITAVGTLGTAEPWAGQLLLFTLQFPATAPTIRQSIQHEYGNNLLASSDSNTVTSGSVTIVGGNAILVALQCETAQGDTPTNGITAISDTLGNNYTLISHARTSGGFGSLVQIFFCPKAIGGTGTQSITFTSVGGQLVGQFESIELSGLTPTPPTVVTITPLNAVAGAESDQINFVTTNSIQTVGSPTDTWGMNWTSPSAVNNSSFGFTISAETAATNTLDISQVQVTVYYQAPGNYIYARDLGTNADGGLYGTDNGTPYTSCYITVGSITLSQLGAPMFPLQHVVGYFDAVGTLHNGGSSYPDMWILPNEVNDTAGIGFIYLPEILQEPPIGQTQPSASLLALRWPVNMMNSVNASQFVHHLQVKIQFEPENAPNTIKAIAFKEDQS